MVGALKNSVPHSPPVAFDSYRARPRRSRTAFFTLGLALAVIGCAHAESPIERGPWSGAVTPASVVVKAKLAPHATTARLLVSTNAELRSPLYSAPDKAGQPDGGNVVALTADHLTPDTSYYYALEVDGNVDQDKRGQFRTFPAGPASFNFAFASCARTGSTNPVFQTILAPRPLFFMNIGDFHYLNLKENSRDAFRAGYDTVLKSPAQAELYRRVPFIYMWDDHDFAGNSSDGTAHARLAARLTYQEYVPHYPLPAGSGDVPIYQAFSVGRVRFILTDLRSERTPDRRRDDASKTMLGATQKAWFKHELLAARGKYPLIFWVSTVPWIGEAGKNYYPTAATQFGHIPLASPEELARLAATGGTTNHPGGGDSWSGYATERRELADFIKENKIRGLCVLNGDAHSLAADDGSHADYATGGGARIPVLQAAPLDQEPRVKGGPFSQGVYKPRRGEGCFGWVMVRDEGKRLTVSYSGRNHRDEEKIALNLSIPAD
jgi:alkaline phosphatase D